MSGGKYVQSKDCTINRITTVGGSQQHFEISDGITVTNPDNAMPVVGQADLLIDGAGKLKFSAAADKNVVLGVSSGKTMTFDCDIERTSGGKFTIGHGSYYGGTVALGAGRSFNAPVDFYKGTLQLADGGSLTNAVVILDGYGNYGRISGGSETEAKITGGVTGGSNGVLTFTNKLAIASDITATATLAADGELSFRKAGNAATTFAISSLKLMDDAVIPVEDGVTTTIAAIDNNGHTLDIRPSGTGKVIFSGLAPGRAPEWLRLNGGTAKIAADHTLVPPSGFVLTFR